MLWIVFPLLLIGFLWICLRQPERTEHDMYLANRPSLTDDEFLSLCDPEVDPSIALKVREIITASRVIRFSMVLWKQDMPTTH